jgi:hypothetical protein
MSFNAAVGSTMKKLFLTGIAALFLATGAAQTAEIKVFEAQKPETGEWGRFVIIRGEINKGNADAFSLKALPGFPKQKVFVGLESNGGEAMEALNIGMIIHKRGFNTLVLDNQICASACALIWLAGRTRYAAPKAAIGFHAIYFGDGNISSGGNALVGVYLRELGLSLKAIRYLTQAPPDGMEWLSAKSAYEYGIKMQVPPGEGEKYE